jgi:hypothetical protein
VSAEDHLVIVVSSAPAAEAVSTIKLLCDSCGRLIYDSDGVDPDIKELTKAAARHRRNPDWIEQSAAQSYMRSAGQ